MTSTGQLIFQKLSGDATVASLVGTRIYPNKAREGDTGARIVYSVITDVPQNTLDGSVGTRLRSIRLQVDCYAPTYQLAAQVADAVDTVLGNLESPSLNAWRENSTDLYDDEAKLHRVLQEYAVWR